MALSAGVTVSELGFADIKLPKIGFDVSFLLVGFSILESQRMVGLRFMRPGLNYCHYWVLGNFGRYSKRLGYTHNGIHIEHTQ
jgi:hypothetical protein